MKTYHFWACVLVLFLAPSLSFGQCPIPANNQFKPFKGGENNASGHFEWYSAAGENPTQGGGHPSHVFERKVTNLGNATLKYDWPVGRMHNEALPAGKADPFCHEYGWPNQKDGPLNYGRGNAKTDTTVWEGKDEPAATAIRSSFTFNVLDKAGTVRMVSVQVESSIQRTSQTQFFYSIAFTNRSDEAVTLSWDVEKDPVVLQELRKMDRTSVFTIERKEALKVAFESTLQPSPVFKGLNILMDKVQMAGAEVPVLLPRVY